MIINTVKFTSNEKVMTAVINGVVIDPTMVIDQKDPQGFFLDCSDYATGIRLV